MLLEDRVIVLSGIGPGTGLAIFRTLIAEGATVITSSRSDDQAEECAQIARSAGATTAHIPCDITDGDQCTALVEDVIERFDRLDGLVNNAFASGMPQGLCDAPVDKLFGLCFNVNVFGTMKMIQAAIPAMKRSGGGSIVAINSMAARKVPERMTAYAASKAALLVSIRGVAQEFGLDGIRANSVVPSHIDGPNLAMLIAWESQKRNITPDQARAEIIAQGVLDHITTPEEIADAVAFLLSDRARGITGQSLDVNAGQMLV